VIEQGESSREIQFRLGRALLVSGEPEEAERHLLLANTGEPHPEALVLLARLYERSGRLEEARAAYGALTKIRNPYTTEARERLNVLGPGEGNAPR
jgi:Flp pilus assembly protein TadD